MEKKGSLLFLSQSDVAPLLTVKDALNYAEEAYRIQHKAIQEQTPSGFVPMGVYRAITAGGSEGFIDCYSGYIQSVPASVCIVGYGYPENLKRFGIRTSNALAILADLETGVPVAIIEAMHLAYVRTGAVGAICSKYLAVSNPENIAFIGAGNLARHMLNAHIEQFQGRIKEVRAWSRSSETRRGFAREMSGLHGIEVEPMENPRETVSGADIVCGCSASTEPRVMNSDVKEGTHINAFGADGPPKQEIDINLLKRSKIIVDSIAQCKSNGEIHKAIERGEISDKNIYSEIHEIVGGSKQGRMEKTEVTVMDSTGIYIQDLILFFRIYKKALDKGIGTWVDLY